MQIYTDENLSSDICSALAIHRLRGGTSSTNIEQCCALFLTTNIDFTSAFNKFYAKNIGRNKVMPVITAFNLSAIAWVKSGSVDKTIPERQLLANAYSAMQPAPEILEKCYIVLNQLETEGKISKDEATSLMADRVTQRELWIDYFPNVDSIDEKYIEKLREKQRRIYASEESQKIEEKYKKVEFEKEQHRLMSIQEKARDYATERKKQYIIASKTIVTVIFTIIVVLCIIGLIKSLGTIK